MGFPCQPAFVTTPTDRAHPRGVPNCSLFKELSRQQNIACPRHFAKSDERLYDPASGCQPRARVKLAKIHILTKPAYQPADGGRHSRFVPPLSIFIDFATSILPTGTSASSADESRFATVRSVSADCRALRARSSDTATTAA
jgi:hypothetical protein